MIGKKKGKGNDLNPLAHLGGYFTSSYVPDGFVQMVYIDTSGFDGSTISSTTCAANFLAMSAASYST